MTGFAAIAGKMSRPKLSGAFAKLVKGVVHSALVHRAFRSGSTHDLLNPNPRRTP